jgi:tryptophan halogenase
MGRPIRKITIVGGGTAGWLTAAMLNHRLQWGYGHPEGVEITLIESPDTPTIGVGESTLPAMKQTLELLEISEAEFVTRTQATFKMGLRFENWHKPGGGRRESFYHPLTGGVQLAGRAPAASLIAYGVPDGLPLDDQLGDIVGHSVAAAERHRSPRGRQHRPYDGTLGYAYHLDAGQLAEFLKEVATARGVVHVLDHVVGLTRTERGHIKDLELKKGGRHPVELVIDCTGFGGVLINKTLGEPFVSYADYLPNDRAVAVQVAHKPGAGLFPATRATALTAGWRWRIPLQTRMGTGYVYASAFIDDQAAIDELAASQADDTPVTNPRVLKMRVGRCARSWVGNVVAIGLSSGFIEPLESTAIQFIDFACRRLLTAFPSTDFEPACQNKFNAEMNGLYDEVRDFLSMHFTLGDRDDTAYWRAMSSEVKRSDQLEECLAIWRHSLPDDYDSWPARVFSYLSLCDVLIGKGFYANGLPPTGADLLPEPIWRSYLDEVMRVRPRLLGPLPTPEEELAAMAKAFTPGESAHRKPMVHTRVQQGVALGPTVRVMDTVSPVPMGAPAPTPPPQRSQLLFGTITAMQGR